MEHVQKTQTDTIAADTAAAVAYLRSPAGGSCKSIFTVGFCFGGSNSWNQAAAGHDLAGAIGFYGHSGRKDAAGMSVIDRVPRMTAPILALQAGADQMITADVNAAFDSALSSAGIEHEIVTYPDTPHSFFDRSYEQHAAASKDAWERILAFVDKHK
jgi:carboxymethylenebutenolidase